ncbi:hypothetical protein [Croceicoccus sp. YJ47]|uniref:hypothetical protein n=1 Tax=Croceicoccus sp. YJ47 TaxID=2798724 RepID=UPI0019234587|nr:hypothetical protein [Croceicoccus sp. YJ47]QQN73957.1 hypothetical protein JD971_14605 [Croceicoccus sp. YJ47]
MIELPDDVVPNGVSASIIDYGITLRPATGGATQRVGRAGSRMRVDYVFPPMVGDKARRVIARLMKAKRVGGIRMPYYLLDVPQGIPGAPVVDGSGQAGTSLSLRGLTPHYAFKEGFWLSIVDENGLPYLHNVGAPAVAGADGLVTLTVEPPLRWPFADGATVLVAQPVVEGFIDGGEWSWDINTARHYGLSVTIEEAA